VKVDLESEKESPKGQSTTNGEVNGKTAEDDEEEEEEGGEGEVPDSSGKLNLENMICKRIL